MLLDEGIELGHSLTLKEADNFVQHVYDWTTRLASLHTYTFLNRMTSNYELPTYIITTSILDCVLTLCRSHSYGHYLGSAQ